MSPIFKRKICFTTNINNKLLFEFKESIFLMNKKNKKKYSEVFEYFYLNLFKHCTRL